MRILFKFLIVLFFIASSALADFMTISDFAFMLSQKERLNVVFDKSVDKNISVFISPQQSNINLLELFNAVLGANGLDSFRVSDTIVVSQSKVEDRRDHNFSSPFSGLRQNSGSVPFSDSSLGSIDVVNGSKLLYSAPFVHRQDFNKSTFSECKDCIFEPLKLNFLNISDLTDFLKFSGVKHHYVKNINTIIFETKKDDNSSVKRVYDVIKSLDVSKRQVQIKLTIFENNINKLSDIGFNPSLSIDFNALSKSGALFKADMVGKFYSSLRFLETENITKVTNYPSFLVSNLEKMEFRSVLNIPFLDENFAFSYQGTNQSQKYKYKSVGFKIDLTPTIVDDFVYLDLDLKFESVVTAGNLPTTSEKSIKNRFMVRRGFLVLLAGIEKESLLNTNEGLPSLKNIPIFGRLFSHDNKNDISETFNIAIEVSNDD